MAKWLGISNDFCLKAILYYKLYKRRYKDTKYSQPYTLPSRQLVSQYTIGPLWLSHRYHMVLPFEMCYRKKFFFNLKHFLWDKSYFYKRCRDDIYRCVAKEKVLPILNSCHSFTYRGYANTSRMLLVTNVIGNISRKHEMPLNKVLEVKTFYVWGINYIGLFPPQSCKYILVEAISSQTCNAKTMIKLFESIIFPRFGVLRAIINDGDFYFIGRQFEALLRKYKYPQLEPTQSYELKFGLIHWLPKFHGLACEDPHKHQNEFHVISRTTTIQKEICGIRKHSRETLHNYWERFNKLCVTCLHHQISEQLLIQYFYEGLMMMDRNMIDAISDGALMDKTPAAARYLILNMASNTQQFGTREVDTSRVENQLTKLTSLVRKLAIRQHQQSAQLRVCGICTSVEHPTDMCPTLQEIELDSAECVRAIGGYHMIVNSSRGSSTSQVQVKGNIKPRDSNPPKACQFRTRIAISNWFQNIKHHHSASNINSKLYHRKIHFQWKNG
ncbi:hypothetical protein CR513_07076, partial [Mucuna pruriens]